MDDASAEAERWWIPTLLFLAMGIALFILTRLNVRFLEFTVVPPHGFPDRVGFEGWTRWDTGWYHQIAELGYSYNGPGQQSAVAFFPAYPFLMRAVGRVVSDTLVAGVVITYAAGAAASLLFYRWCSRMLTPRVARVALLLLLTYPFAFYLFGAVYSDALFLLAAVGAFTLLEDDHPILAGLAAAAATAARPVGVALMAALVVRALERRGFFARGITWRERLAVISPADAGVLLSVGGIAAYCALLWARFDDPFAFARVGSASGWHRQLDVHTAIKADFFDLFARPDLSAPHAALGIQAIATLIGLALTPVIVRRLGWGYAAFTLIAIALPALTSKDFIGMGRYVLVAFPCFAAAACILDGRSVRRVLLRGAAVAANAAALVLMHSYFVRWYFFS